MKVVILSLFLSVSALAQGAVYGDYIIGRANHKTCSDTLSIVKSKNSCIKIIETDKETELCSTNRGPKITRRQLGGIFSPYKVITTINTNLSGIISSTEIENLFKGVVLTNSKTKVVSYRLNFDNELLVSNKTRYFSLRPKAHPERPLVYTCHYILR